MEGHTTFARTRKQGTRETLTSDPAVRLAAFRRIVERCQYEKVDGTMIDLFSASMVCQVYDALSDGAKVKFLSLPAGKMALFALKLIDKSKGAS